jgi:hypothetical protein
MGRSRMCSYGTRDLCAPILTIGLSATSVMGHQDSRESGNAPLARPVAQANFWPHRLFSPSSRSAYRGRRYRLAVQG